MDRVWVDAKRAELENARQGALDKANLELQPLQAQMNQIILRVTEVTARINGQLSMLDYFGDENPANESILSSAVA